MLRPCQNTKETTVHNNTHTNASFVPYGPRRQPPERHDWARGYRTHQACLELLPNHYSKPYASDELIIITGVDTVQKMAYFFNYKNGAPSPLHALPEGPKCKDRPECYVTGGVMFKCNTSAPAGPKVVVPNQGVRPRAPYIKPRTVCTRGHMFNIFSI